MVLDNDILDFVIIRKGQFYFEYLNFWRDLHGEERVISLLDFKTTIISNFRQVMNFYSQHWLDKIEAVVLVTSGLNDEIKKIIVSNFSFVTKDLILRLDRPIGAEWFSVLGTGLRGVVKRKEDRDISLLGTTARDEFRMEQVLSFMRFWRVLVPVAVGFLLFLFLATNFFLIKRNQVLESQSPIGDNKQFLEVGFLGAEAKIFNRSLDLVVEARGSKSLRTLVLDKIFNFLKNNDITLTKFSFQNFDASLTLQGEARTQNQVLDFKKSLESEPGISEVTLPLKEIKPISQGFSFLINFKINSPNIDSKIE